MAEWSENAASGRGRWGRRTKSERLHSLMLCRQSFWEKCWGGVAVRFRKKVIGYPGILSHLRLPGISLPGDRTVHLQCAGNDEIREYSRVEVQLRLQGARKSMQSTYSPSGMGWRSSGTAYRNWQSNGGGGGDGEQTTAISASRLISVVQSLDKTTLHHVMVI